MLREAVRRLAEIGTPRAVSSLYETDPVGYADQPPFLNAVVALETTLPAAEIVRRLLAIERDLGRTRTFRNAPRTLDLDLLLLGDLVADDAPATVPHPRMQERAFVLVPLAEIAPAVAHPVLQQSIDELLAALPDRSGVRQYHSHGWDLMRTAVDTDERRRSRARANGPVPRSQRAGSGAEGEGRAPASRR